MVCKGFYPSSRSKGAHKTFFSPAPKSASIEDLTMAGFSVKMGIYTGNPQVTTFKVEAQTACGIKNCLIERSSEELKCAITGISSGTQFFAKVSACLPDAFGCSAPLKMMSYTIPSRKCKHLKYRMALKGHLPSILRVRLLYSYYISPCCGHSQ